MNNNIKMTFTNTTAAFANLQIHIVMEILQILFLQIIFVRIQRMLMLNAKQIWKEGNSEII